MTDAPLFAALNGETATPVDDGGKPGDRDVFRRPHIEPTGWRWWLDDAGQRSVAFYEALQQMADNGMMAA